MSDTSDPSASSSATWIVSEALELEGSTLQDYLDRACGEDSALRREVRELLDVARDHFSEDFLEVPAAEALLGASNSDTKPPEEVGDFRLLKRLGTGGMGAVYLAQQHHPVRRKVALKLLRGSSSARLRQRFAGEWQALAGLSHPHIATLFEVGESADGQWPYVAMEWVDGAPITTRSDLLRLDLATRLEIFLDVCDGISHAHEKGILHCDLKPGNVLLTEVDGRHVAKVIDFGIARFIDDSLLRSEASGNEILAGSPPYLSPEAAAVDGAKEFDTRTDVHALGLLLYELLTGVLPFDHEGGLFESLHLVRAQDPPIPSQRFSELDQQAQMHIAMERSMSAQQLRRRLSGDLDAIVLRATARDPRQRYGSPAALASDVTRYLDRRPVDARRPTPFYVARRFAQRHAALAASAGLVTLALIAGLVARSIEADRANRALVESEQMRTFLLELFEQADPERAAGSSLTVGELLDQGRDRLRTELDDLPHVKAQLLQVIGTVSTKLDQLTTAEETIREALEIQQKLLPAEHPDLLATQNELGVVLRRLGRLDEAEALLSTVLQARLQNPQVDLESLARAHSNLGNVYFSQRRYQEAEDQHREALQLRERARSADDTVDSRNNVAISANNLGAVLRLQNKFEEAQHPLLLAAEIFRAENPALLGSALNNLGSVLRAGRSWRQAEIYLREAIDAQEKSLGAAHSRTLQSHRNLILTLADQGQHERALEAVRLAIERAEESEDVIGRAQVWNTAGVAQRLANLPRAATQSQDRCLELISEARGAEHPVARRCLGHRAHALALEGREKEALRDVQQLTALESDSLTRAAEIAIGRTLIELGLFDQAVPHLLRYRELLGGRHEGLALFELARSRNGQGRHNEARRLFDEARERLTDRFGPDHALVTRTVQALEAVPQNARK